MESIITHVPALLSQSDTVGISVGQVDSIINRTVAAHANVEEAHRTKRLWEGTYRSGFVAAIGEGIAKAKPALQAAVATYIEEEVRERNVSETAYLQRCINELGDEQENRSIPSAQTITEIVLNELQELHTAAEEREWRVKQKARDEALYALEIDQIQEECERAVTYLGRRFTAFTGVALDDFSVSVVREKTEFIARIEYVSSSIPTYGGDQSLCLEVGPQIILEGGTTLDSLLELRDIIDWHSAHEYAHEVARARGGVEHAYVAERAERYNKLLSAYGVHSLKAVEYMKLHTAESVIDGIGFALLLHVGTTHPADCTTHQRIERASIAFRESALERIMESTEKDTSEQAAVKRQFFFLRLAASAHVLHEQAELYGADANVCSRLLAAADTACNYATGLNSSGGAQLTTEVQQEIIDQFKAAFMEGVKLQSAI